jgi:hypothetical protein
MRKAQGKIWLNFHSISAPEAPLPVCVLFGAPFITIVAALYERRFACHRRSQTAATEEKPSAWGIRTGMNWAKR